MARRGRAICSRPGGSGIDRHHRAAYPDVARLDELLQSHAKSQADRRAGCMGTAAEMLVLETVDATKNTGIQDALTGPRCPAGVEIQRQWAKLMENLG